MVKSRWTGWVFFSIVSVLLLSAAVCLNHQQTVNLKIDEQNETSSLEESAQNLKVLEKYFKADAIVSQMTYNASYIDNGGFRVVLKTKEINGLKQLCKSSFFAYIQQQYAPELLDFLACVDVNNQESLQYFQSNCSVSIIVPHDQQDSAYTVQIVWLPHSDLIPTSFENSFNAQDYFITYYTINDKEKIVVAQTPAYMIYTRSEALQHKSIPVIYYLYTYEGKLSKIRMLMGQSETVTAKSEVFKPLNILLQDQIHFSEADIVKLQKAIDLVTSGKIATQKQKMKTCLWTIKKAQLKTMPASKIRNYIELTISL